MTSDDLRVLESAIFQSGHLRGNVTTMLNYRKGIRFRTPLARMPIALSLLLGFVLSKLDLLLKILFYLYHVSFFFFLVTVTVI